MNMILIARSLPISSKELVLIAFYLWIIHMFSLPTVVPEFIIKRHSSPVNSVKELIAWELALRWHDLNFRTKLRDSSARNLSCYSYYKFFNAIPCSDSEILHSFCSVPCFVSGNHWQARVGGIPTEPHMIQCPYTIFFPVQLTNLRVVPGYLQIIEISSLEENSCFRR